MNDAERIEINNIAVSIMEDSLYPKELFEVAKRIYDLTKDPRTSRERRRYMRLIDADALLSRLKQPTVEDINEVLRVEYDTAPNDAIAAEAIHNMYETVREAIKDAPTIESPRPDWTPCAEGLPEEGQEVLFDVPCDMMDGDLYGTHKGRYEDGTFLIEEYDHDSHLGVIAKHVTQWMPCPKPATYRADQKEDAECKE